MTKTSIELMQKASGYMLAAGNAQKREIMCNGNLKTHNVKEAKPSNTKKSPKRQK